LHTLKGLAIISIAGGFDEESVALTIAVVFAWAVYGVDSYYRNHPAPRKPAWVAAWEWLTGLAAALGKALTAILAYAVVLGAIYLLVKFVKWSWMH
jgi:hypothetical protein